MNTQKKMQNQTHSQNNIISSNNIKMESQKKNCPCGKDCILIDAELTIGKKYYLCEKLCPCDGGNHNFIEWNGEYKFTCQMKKNELNYVKYRNKNQFNEFYYRPTSLFNNKTGERIYYDVKYSEKDKFKNLGGKWNPELKKWYVVDNSSYNKKLFSDFKIL